MSSVDATLPAPGAFLDPEDVTERFRTLALLAGLGLVASFLSVFKYITDVAGGTTILLVVSILSLVAATKLADRLDVRTATMLGGGLFLGGLFFYLATVPEVLADMLHVDFFLTLYAYTTGVSVLQFLRVDVWAVALAPGPTFLCWYLLLRHRYTAAVVVGSLPLGFFATTGDASEVAVLGGVVAGLAVLAFGTLEQVEGNWGHVERFGLVAVLVVIAARTLEVIPEGNETGIGGFGTPTLEATLLDSDNQVEILGSISLSPEVRFTIEAPHGGYWKVGAYDRYTGRSWLRTGSNSNFTGRVDPPPGSTIQLRQEVEVETRVRSLPAAWKPVSFDRAPDARVAVTSLDGLALDGSLEEGEEYTVVSEIPERTRERLVNAGEDYPEEITNRFLEVPNDMPGRVSQHAERITAGASTPYEQAVAIEEWLTANKGYSLDVNRPNGDIVDGFIFGMDQGYCVYFASAMTVMLRTLDVPSRFVVGYSTGQSVDDNTWVVRGLDSHAWVEVYFPEVGWVPFDPTPSTARVARRRRRIQVARRNNATNVDTRDSLPSTPTATPTSTAFDGRLGTDDGVDESGTSETPRGADSSATDSTLTRTRPRGVLAANQNRPVNISPTATGTGAPESQSVIDLIEERDRISLLAGAAGVVMGVHHFGLVNRAKEELWLRYQPRTDSPQDDVERAYDRLERYFAREYRERDEGETPRQYVKSLAESGASIDEPVRHVASVYERTRYADEVDREEADKTIDIVDDIVKNGVDEPPSDSL